MDCGREGDMGSSSPSCVEVVGISSIPYFVSLFLYSHHALVTLWNE